MLSVDDLAEIFGVSNQTIYKALKDGKFGNPIQMGRSYKIPKIYIIQKFITEYE
jgi:excisionase family DNA binding protein